MRRVDEALTFTFIYASPARGDRLGEAEKDFAYAAVARNLETDENFFPRIMALWMSDFKDSPRLKAIFSENKDLWAKTARFFPVL